MFCILNNQNTSYSSVTYSIRKRQEKSNNKRKLSEKKAGNLFQDFLLGGAAGGRLVFSFESSGQGGPMDRQTDFIIYYSVKIKL